jgi:fatty acid desaturase
MAALVSAPTSSQRLRSGPPVVEHSMRPDSIVLPEVLPTDQLNDRGRPLGALRSDLTRIPNLRNVGHVIGLWIQSVGVIVAALWTHHWLAWIAAFFLMGRAHARFAILGHEAAHRLLFSNKRSNDWVGAWLIAYPAFVPIDAYRRGHMAHHKEEFGPNEPDLMLYAGYPISRDSWRRKLTRDAVGISGWKNLKLLIGAFRSPTARPVALRIVAAQVVIAVGFAAAGYPLVWPLLWLAPWLTVWRVINRLRAVAEHGGMGPSPDRRLTTHHARQGFWARFWMVPFNTGWHLAHHVDIGVPFSRLPRLHRELAAAGWIPPALEYPSYRALWKRARSGGSSVQPMNEPTANEPTAD